MVVALAMTFMLIGVGAVQAGGSWLEPTWVRVEAGDQIELSGSVSRGQLGWVDDGPYFGYLRGDGYGVAVDEGLGGAKTDVPLGKLAVQDRGHDLFVSITVTIPVDTPPGEYWINFCNDPCSTGLGDLIGSVVYVGMDPPQAEEETSEAETTSTAEAATPTTSTTTSAAPTSTDTPEVATVAATSAPPETVVTTTVAPPVPKRMSLAPYPDRPDDMSPLWIGMSAALGGAVLLIALVSRQRG